MVDWNSFKNGTQIVVLGYNFRTNKLRVVKRESIKKGGSENPILSKHMQEEAIARIITNFHAFEAKAVYVDKGFGGFQTETLEKYFYEIGQHSVFQAVDFGSAHRDINPFTGENRSRGLKGVLVYSLQRQFEKRRIELSVIEEGRIEDMDASFEDKLTYQLNNYAIDHFTNRDEPVFSHKGDHALDALMIANFGFMEKIENSLDFTPNYGSGIMITNKAIIKESRPEGKPSLRTGFMNIVDRALEERITFGEPKKIPSEIQKEEMNFGGSVVVQKKKQSSTRTPKIKRSRFC